MRVLGRGFLLCVSLVTANTVHADQYKTISPSGKEHVVHSRRAPVMMHRAFPPYTGIHVYEGELSRGRRVK